MTWKEFERDYWGAVEYSSSNLSKMNIFEYIYFTFKDWGAVDDILVLLGSIVYGLYALILLMVFPVLLLISAIHGIMLAKKEVSNVSHK